MQQIEYSGLSLFGSPFITTILAPQLKMQHASLTNTNDIGVFIESKPDYIILEDSIIWNHLMRKLPQLTILLATCTTSIALSVDKAYKKKVQLLDLGFTHCLDIPIATEIITKTVTTTLHKKKPEKQVNFHYDTSSPLSLPFLHDAEGNAYLVQGKHPCYLTPAEKGILDYLQRRKGYASRQELAYAGWKSFNVKPNTVTVTVRNLRLKLKRQKMPYAITNLYGFGYMITTLLTHFRGNQKDH